MKKTFDLRGIEEKLRCIETTGNKIIELSTGDLKAYAEACLKIKNIIKKQRPDAILCSVPESYALGKILYKTGIKGIKMFPAITKENREIAYNSISSIVEHQEKNHLSVAFIDCTKDFTMTPLGFLVTSIEDEIGRNSWNEYFLRFSALRISKRDKDFSEEGEQKLCGINENEQRTILYEHSMLNDFAAPNIFSSQEIVGAKCDRGLARAKHSAKIVLHDKAKRYDLGKHDSHEFFVNSIVNQLKGS